MRTRTTVILGVVALAGLLGSTAVASQRVTICHFVGHVNDHLDVCSAEEHRDGGKSVSVAESSLEVRHGL